MNELLCAFALGAVAMALVRALADARRGRRGRRGLRKRPPGPAPSTAAGPPDQRSARSVPPAPAVPPTRRPSAADPPVVSAAPAPAPAPAPAAAPAPVPASTSGPSLAELSDEQIDALPPDLPGPAPRRRRLAGPPGRPPMSSL